MPRARGRRAILLPILWLATTVGSCAERDAPPAPPDRTVWPGGVWEPPRRPYDLAHRELAVLQLPWAGDAGPDPPPQWWVAARAVRFIVNLESSRREGVTERSLSFRGKRWALSAGSRATAFEHLQEELEALRRNRVISGERLEMLVRADHLSPWADVRDVLRVVADPRLQVARTSFGVACGDPRESGDGRVDADPVEGPFPAAPPTTLVWSMEEGPVLRVGEREMPFPAGDPYLAGPALDAANASWRAALAVLRDTRAGGAAAVAMQIDPRVPWAHVAQTLGLLIAADLPEVHLEGDRAYRLSTPAHERPNSRDGVEVVAHDPPAALVLALGSALAVALFGLLAVTSRAHRRPAARA